MNTLPLLISAQHEIYETLTVWPGLDLPDRVLPLSPLFCLFWSLLETSMVLSVFIRYALPPDV